MLTSRPFFCFTEKGNYSVSYSSMSADNGMSQVSVKPFFFFPPLIHFFYQRSWVSLLIDHLQYETETISGFRTLCENGF